MGVEEAGLIQTWFDQDEITERAIYPLTPVDKAEAYFDYFDREAQEVRTYYLYLERKRTRPMTAAEVDQV